MRPDLSVVIPIRDEVENLPELWRRLRATLPANAEVIFVDDGSRDGSWQALDTLAALHPAVRAIRFRRNFGQTAAMACGIRSARGDTIVTMDGDLQNDPADIAQLVQPLAEGYDVVCGWRLRRQDRLWSRKVPSFVANRLIGALTGVHLRDYGCSLKAYRGDIIRRVPLYGELHRFIPALAALTGAAIKELPVAHHPRRFGRTKYSLSRTWRVALDMLTVAMLVKFLDKPLRLFGVAAVITAAFGAWALSRAWPHYVGPDNWIPQTVSGVGLLFWWLAGHLITLGLVAEHTLAAARWRPDVLAMPDVEDAQ